LRAKFEAVVVPRHGWQEYNLFSEQLIHYIG